MNNNSNRELILSLLPVILIPLTNIIASTTLHAPHLTSMTESCRWVLNLQVAMVYVIGAVAEELFFRFFLLKHIFLRTMKPALAIILVSILFAGMHLFNLRTGQPIDQTFLQMGCAFAFSIWAGAVTWKSTWLIPLLAHVLMNATATDNISWLCLVISTAVLTDGLILIKEENIQ